MATLNGFPPNFDPRDFHLDRPHVDEERQKQMKKILLRKKQEDAKRKAEEEERKRVEELRKKELADKGIKDDPMEQDHDLPPEQKLEVLQQRLETLRVEKSNMFGLLKIVLADEQRRKKEQEVAEKKRQEELAQKEAEYQRKLEEEREKQANSQQGQSTSNSQGQIHGGQNSSNSQQNQGNQSSQHPSGGNYGSGYQDHHRNDYDYQSPHSYRHRYERPVPTPPNRAPLPPQSYHSSNYRGSYPQQPQRYNMMNSYNQYNQQPYTNYPPIGYGVNVNYNTPQSMMGPPYQNYGNQYPPYNRNGPPRPYLPPSPQQNFPSSSGNQPPQSDYRGRRLY